MKFTPIEKVIMWMIGACVVLLCITIPLTLSKINEAIELLDK